MIINLSKMEWRLSFKMPIPKPKKYERKKSYLPRCIDNLAKQDPNRKNKQRVAICYSTWTKAKKERQSKCKKRI